MPTSAATAYQFGPFEVNPASGELLKEGRRVRLQDQPFRLLVILLENAGRVVPREEIQRRIWQDTTFVDFDSSLRVAVRKLRDALGDDADNPRYVETIPKRGYRILVPVIPVSNSASRVPTRIGEFNAIESSAKPRSGFKVSRSWIVSAGLLLAVACVGSFLFISHGPRKLTGNDTVVLAEFTNSTGDPVFDKTLRRGMAVQLDQSPFLSLVSEQRIQRTLAFMGKPADVPLTPEVASDICERVGAAAVLDGSIASLGNQYVIGLRAVDCRTGEVLDREQAQAAKKEDTLNALDQIASRFRSRVGESLTTIREHNTPLTEATTPSLEALKAFSMAENIHHQSGPDAALPLYQHAIELDPGFAIAYADMGNAYGELGESDFSAQATTRAYDLRNRTSDQEKFFITLSYQFRVVGNLEKAIQICDAWVRTYPRDMRPHGFLSSMLQMIGQHARAIEEAQKNIELDPDFDIGYADLASAYQNLGRFDDAEESLRRAAQRRLQFPDYAVVRYQLAFLKGDEAGMVREEAEGESKLQARVYQNEALALAYSAHVRQANQQSRRSVELAQESGQRESAALFAAGDALFNAFYGVSSPAKRSANEALQLSKDREVEYGAAFALALAGDYSESRILADDLARRFPEDTSVQLNYLPSLRALLAIKANRASEAIGLLEAARTCELGMPRSTIHGYFGALYPVYVRGLAYLAARQGNEAVSEFQKILAHRGIVANDPMAAIARLQLGRAYVLAGDVPKAKAAYTDFLRLWKDADPGIPILEQARAEHAKLE